MTHPTHETEHPRDSLAKRVFASIEREGLLPRAKWTFVVSNVLFWGLGALSVVLGALAFSAALFEVLNADWNLFAATHSSFFSFFLSAAPFVWLLAIALFVGVGYENIRRTKRGYRYTLTIIVLGAVLTSVTLGTALYAIGLGEFVEEGVGDHPPFYRPVMLVEHSQWSHPEAGVLGGTIVSVGPDLSTFDLQDFQGQSWTVTTDDLENGDLTVVARAGEVRVVGVPATTSQTVFHACFVFPWEVRGGHVPPLPPPLAFFASTSERNNDAERSEECRDIRPYKALRDIPR